MNDTAGKDAKPSNQVAAVASAAKKPRAWLGPLLAFLVALVTFVTNQKVILEGLQRADAAAAAAVSSVSITSFAGEFSERFKSCDYKYLFICEPKPPATCMPAIPMQTCLATDIRGRCLAPSYLPPPSCTYPSGPQKLPGQIDILLHAPDAIAHVLSQRFRLGIVPFVLMLAFVSISVLIVIASGSNGIGYFWVSIPLAPVAASVFFWLVQQGLLALATAIGLLLQAFILVAGIPLILFWLKAARDAHSLYVAGKNLSSEKADDRQ